MSIGLKKGKFSFFVIFLKETICLMDGGCRDANII